MTTPATGITAGEIARRVAELGQLRKQAVVDSINLRYAREAFERAHAFDIAKAKESQAAVDAAETALRAIVAEHYAATAEKKPAPGIEVKTRATLSYDRAEALRWGKSVGMALVPEALDVKAFEKIAKATRLDFVTYGEEPMVTIATDLDKALAAAPAAIPASQEA